MHWRVVAVVLVAVTAGCGSVGGLASGPPAETVTPAPVPTPPPAPEDPRMGLAPGVNASGIFDMDYLVAHHLAAAAGTSYVWEEHERQYYRRDDATLRTNSTQRVVLQDGTTYQRFATALDRYEQGEHRFYESYQAYADGERRYARWIQLGEPGTQYARGPTTDVRNRFAALPAGEIRQYLDLEDQRVERLPTVGDRPHYRITGTRSWMGYYGPVENYTARAVVREDGFVRSINASFDTVRADRQVRVVYTSRYTNVGNATVTEPGWVDDVRAHVSEE